MTQAKYEKFYSAEKLCEWLDNNDVYVIAITPATAKPYNFIIFYRDKDE